MAACYQVMRDCWGRQPRQRPRFRAVLAAVTRLQTSARVARTRGQEAWSSGGRRRGSSGFLATICDKDVEDYDLSTHTATYEYEVFRTVQKTIG